MSNIFTFFSYNFQGSGDRPFTCAKHHTRKTKPDQELLKTEETEGWLQETQ